MRTDLCRESTCAAPIGCRSACTGMLMRRIMKRCGPGVVGSVLLAGTVLPGSLEAETEKGPYARIAILRPHDGDTVDFEAGYSRHLDWHRQAKDTWTWYGWTIWAGE